MSGAFDLGEVELRSRLMEFDRAVAMLYPDRAFRLVLVGGGAMVLLGCLARATSDLDALVFPRELLSLMEQYDLSGRVTAYQDHFAYNLEDRLVHLGLPTTAVECCTASLEDIVASKLYSDRPTDAVDVRRPEVLAALDWDRLDEVVTDMEGSMLVARRHTELLRAYAEYRREFGPCEN
ncbi:MAG: DUF6036 family nucleotidyltransferase [Coriobacteriia bacterium]